MKKEKSIIMGLSIVCLGLLLIILYSYNLSQSEQIYKIILRADNKLSEISIDSQMAESYYLEAGSAYEHFDYKSVALNSRLAREYYHKESQGYKEVKAELKAMESNDKLIVLYIEGLDLLSEIALNMFEACEHFESTANYYDIYYNTNVPFDDMSFEMGGGELDMMNEKIAAHDNNVGKYNDILSEFGVELEKRIKE